MADPADIGPQYQCDECGVWSPDTTCVQCGAELGEANKGVPVVFAKKAIAEGEVAPHVTTTKFTVQWLSGPGRKVDLTDVRDQLNALAEITKGKGNQ